MFLLTILEKTKEARLKFLQGSVCNSCHDKSWQIMKNQELN